MAQVVFDSTKQDLYFVTSLSLEEAADILRQYLPIEENSAEKAAEFLMSGGFHPADIDCLPEGEILLCRIGDEEESGVYEINSSVIVGSGLPLEVLCDPKWQIAGFIESFPLCEDPLCEGGCGDGCRY